MRTTFLVPMSNCLSCGVGLNAAGGMNDDGAPRPNDAIMVCIKCGHLMGFDESGHLRELNDIEAQFAAGNPDILMIQLGRKLAGIEPDKPKNIWPKQLRSVRYSDGAWYPARIIDKLTDGRWRVRWEPADHNLPATYPAEEDDIR